MAHVGTWNGVDPGAAGVESPDRQAQNANYRSQAQRFNMLSMRESSGTAPGLDLWPR